jgi:hypothetical protein
MSAQFDPSKAEAVENDFFDKFMEQMVWGSARAQTKQIQQVTDSLRVLLEMTRQDSEQLLSKYRDEFDTWAKQQADQMQEKLDQSSAIAMDVRKVASKSEESFDRVMTRADAMSTSLGRVEKLVKDLAAAPKNMDPDNGSIRTILSEVATIRAQLETPREDKMGILIDMVKAMKEAVPQKKSWTFTVERDDFARIKNVTATSD